MRWLTIGAVLVVGLLSVAACSSVGGSGSADWTCLYDTISCECSTNGGGAGEVPHCDADPPSGPRLPENKCCMRCDLDGDPYCVCSTPVNSTGRDAGCDYNPCSGSVGTNVRMVKTCPPQ